MLRWQGLPSKEYGIQENVSPWGGTINRSLIPGQREAGRTLRQTEPAPSPRQQGPARGITSARRADCTPGQGPDSREKRSTAQAARVSPRSWCSVRGGLRSVGRGAACVDTLHGPSGGGPTRSGLREASPSPSSSLSPLPQSSGHTDPLATSREGPRG